MKNYLPSLAGSDAGTVTSLVIGAGHAGLAISQQLTQRSIDHVVLERGEVANSWRTERWDSLRLLTPNWQKVLPGYRYAGSDPDGYMSMSEIIEFITRYSTFAAAPVRTNTTVISVQKSEYGYKVITNQGEWRCRSVILASGACNKASVPAMAKDLPSSVQSLTPMQYKNPSQLDPGAVLVVGASASGLQLAKEIQESGRQVTLAVGEHVRMPRTYRSRDIQWWMDAAGILDRSITEEDDPVRARRIPSPQLIGSVNKESLDLNSLTDAGVSLVGRLAAIRDGSALFSGSLRNCCAMADLKLNRLLDLIDDYAATDSSLAISEKGERLAPTRLPERAQLKLDFHTQNIKTVVWATGYQSDYSWLHLPVLDRKGKLCHDRGVVGTDGMDSGGLYAMGLTYMRRRKSSFIYGAEDDASEITRHLYDYLGREARQRRNKSVQRRCLNFLHGIKTADYKPNQPIGQ